MHLNLKLLSNFKANPNVQQTFPLISLEAMKGKLLKGFKFAYFEVL
jgi:hypothetical protein